MKQHWPAIDALRGAAVLAVLLYHHDAELLPGGYLGVSLFFTLSGFLITTLLLGEQRDTGRISIGRFWARRLRRLAPVALAGLVLAVAVAAVTHPPQRLGEIGGDVRAAVLHVANWRLAAGGVEYGDTFSLPSPVAHYWSLAIEEQFYAVYPVVALLALRRGRRTLAAVLAAVTAASVARQLGVDANRAYLGTDTRAAELAIGALAAVARARRPAGARGSLDLAATVAAAGLLAAWATVELGHELLWRGGMVLHAAGSAAVVVGAADGRRFAGALGRCRPLLALGAISYGAYVVHFPLFLLVDAERTGVDGPALLGIRLLATVAAAALLHVLVEQPVRIGGALPRRQGGIALASAMAAAVVLATALPHVERSSSPAATVAAGEPTLVTMPAVDAPAPAPAPPDPAAAGAPADLVPAPGAPAAPAVEPAAAVAPDPPAPAVPPSRLLVVGDSSAEFVGAGMQSWAAERGVQVDLVYEYACTFLHEGEYLIRDGWVHRQSDACAALVDTAVRVARERQTEAILVFAGNFQVASWRPSPDVPFSAVGDPLVDARVLAALTDAVGRLASVDVPVVVADLPVPAWDADYPTPGGTLPGSGPPTINDPVRVARLNLLTTQAVATQPLARLLPWSAILAGGDGTIDSAARVDGLHVDPELVESLMDGALGETISLLTR